MDEGAWRFWLPVGTFLAVALLEGLRPRDGVVAAPMRRWAGHALLYAAGAALVAILPWAPAAAAAWAAAPGRPPLRIGGLPPAVGVGVGVALLDLAHYAAHRLMHSRPLWRLHALHHADRRLDVSTAVRHHPLETVIAASLLGGVAVAFALPPEAVAAHAALALSVALAAHANVELPAPLERWLSRLVVTPGVHARHHSDAPRDFGRNFGAVSTLWDRVFGTFVEAPAPGVALRFGLSGSAARDAQLVRR